MNIDPDKVCCLAQNLARNTGWHVFPCSLPKKLPAIPKDRGGNGFYDATTDPDGIADLWRRGHGDLIGIATGETSGIDVLDVDIKHENAVRWWDVASKRIPPTRIYQTGSGGFHIYFQHAPGVKNTQSKLAHGVDTRGDGGYAIYWFAAGKECGSHAPVAPWPSWLLKCVLWEKPQPKPTKQPKVRGTSDAALGINGVLHAISGAREGERNAILYWGAKRLGEKIVTGNIQKIEAAGLLIAAGRAAGLDEKEAVRTVNSALGG